MPEVDLAAEREECRFLWPPIILVVIFLWVVPLGSSLGLDETGNWWVAKSGLRAAATARMGLWPGSLAYDLVVMAARRIGGDNEIVLRLPSVFAMAGTAFLLYGLGRRMIGPLAGMFACLAFVSMRDVIYQASNLRPYSLALYCLVGAMLALVNWLDAGGLRHAVTYATLAALTVYFHSLFGVMFVIHALYVFLR